MSTEENKAIARRYWDEAWSKGNTAIVDELYAPRAENEDLKQFIRAVFPGFPDWRSTIDAMIAEGDLVAHRWTGGGTHQGEYQGIPATGRQVTLRGLAFTRIVDGRIVDGRIVEGEGYYDTVALLQQLGATAIPPSGETGA